MSACLLSLSVTSLLLPVCLLPLIWLELLRSGTGILDLVSYFANFTRQTAFHASFTDSVTADSAVLHVSRGTSVVSLGFQGDWTPMLIQLDTAPGLRIVPSFPIEISCVHVRKYTATRHRRGILSRSFGGHAGIF